MKNHWLSPPTINNHLKLGTELLAGAGINSASLDALILLEYVLNIDRARLLAKPKEEVPNHSSLAYRTLLARRYKHEPLAYILGYKDFYGFKINVNHNVLIPRPETEALVTEASKRASRDDRVLELGTGSGAISLVLKKLRPDLRITATDISQSALNTAITNLKNHGVRVKLQKSDMFDKVTGKYNLILANLPYVNPEIVDKNELAFEPKKALYSGEKGLNLYKKFIRQFSQYLASGGFALVEFDPSQYTSLRDFGQINNVSLTKLSNFVYLIKPLKR